MPKPSKSSTQEFMTKRRQAIADMANKRQQQQLLRVTGAPAQENASKVSQTVSLPGAPRATTN